ncbi:MAG TPA: cob(I)yrinic acid a,c-diamide adenosyltransferase [Fibrobacteria bacterium]|nr:cob(I)yrinic acid a,c-diamide adenosyltransferase [Fibrobacteria bacterium]
MAIHITRVYTRGGDKGKTSLVGGVRVDKASLKLDSYGAVDELNCLVGIARAALAADSALPAEDRENLDRSLRLIQNRLFDVGSILATPAGKPYPGMPEILDGHAAELERAMDAMQGSLEPLKSFCLPGGTAANAALHHCRAVCRRAERDILYLAREEKVDPRVVKYVNRLSDLFFVMARYAACKAGAPEYLWEFGLSSRGKAGEAVPEKSAEAGTAEAETVKVTAKTAKTKTAKAGAQATAAKKTPRTGPARGRGR